MIKKATEYYDKSIAADVDKYSYINEVIARVAGIYENLHLLIDEPLDENYNHIIETSDDEDKKKLKIFLIVRMKIRLTIKLVMKRENKG